MVLAEAVVMVRLVADYMKYILYAKDAEEEAEVDCYSLTVPEGAANKKPVHSAEMRIQSYS